MSDGAAQEFFQRVLFNRLADSLEDLVQRRNKSINVRLIVSVTRIDGGSLGLRGAVDNSSIHKETLWT